MSRTSIPENVKIRVAAKAAGRCSFRGCNALLTVHELTQKRATLSNFAHIVADSPDGPRGDAVRSHQLAKDEANVMLLCQKCHKLVDDLPAEYPEALLLEMKREHEARVKRQTEVGPDQRTTLIVMEANIGEQRFVVDTNEVRDAVRDRYVAEHPIRIVQNLASLTDDQSTFWEIVRAETAKQLREQYHPRRSEGAIRHLTVAALAPIPCLIDLGAQLGDIATVDVLARRREPKTWAWDVDRDPATYQLSHVEGEADAHGPVLLLVSVTGVCSPAPTDVRDECVAEYHLVHERPGTDRVVCRADRARFRRAFDDALATIVARHGATGPIHLLCAVPNVLAVEIGRARLPKAQPAYVVYDYNAATKGWTRALTIGEA